MIAPSPDVRRFIESMNGANIMFLPATNFASEYHSLAAKTSDFPGERQVGPV